MHYNGYNNHVNNYHTNVFITGNGEVHDAFKWKQKLQSILEQIPETEEKLTPIIHLIVAALEPSKIYRVQHKSEGEGADYIDLMVIIPGNRNKPFAEMESAITLPFSTEAELHCSLHSEPNVRRALEYGHLFYTLTIRPENLIYDSKVAVPLPQSSTDALSVIRENISERWKQDAAKALQFYTMALVPGVDSAALRAFMLHQAAELTLRAMIQNLIGVEKKTHEIRVLKKHVRRIAPELTQVFSDENEVDVQLLQILDDAYLKARYDNQFIISEEQLQILGIKVKTLMKKAADAVQQHLDSLASA